MRITAHAIWTLWTAMQVFESLGKRPSFGWGTEIQQGDLIAIGDHFSCGKDCLLAGPMRIGRDVHLNNNVHINAGNGGWIEIGDHVLIGPNTVLRASNHKFRDSHRMIVDQGHRPGRIHIEGDVWLGANVTVTPGTRIGCGAVIGGGSVVTKYVPEYEVWAGNPARKIGQRI